MQLAVSDSGTLVYLRRIRAGTRSPDDCGWIAADRRRRCVERRRTGATRAFHRTGTGLPSTSSLPAATPDVWIYEWARDTATKLTFDPGVDAKPVWTPDGRRIAFTSNRTGANGNLFWQRADGADQAQRLIESTNTQVPGSWHPSGKFLAFSEQNPSTSWDILILPVEGDEASGWKIGKPTAFLNGPSAEQEPMFSPDGRWLAYFSDESRQPQVYVRPFPGPGGLQQISNDGGTYPSWSPTRSELFFREPGRQQILVASVHRRRSLLPRRQAAHLGARQVAAATANAPLRVAPRRWAHSVGIGEWISWQQRAGRTKWCSSSTSSTSSGVSRRYRSRAHAPPSPRLRRDSP